MQIESVGVVATSSKENEHRLPIHPGHLGLLAPEIRPRLCFEHGYGERFGVADQALADFGCRLASRSHLLAESDVVLLPKPMPVDLAALREGGILWGWPHCVQQRELTQIAIDRRLTLIAWEAMFHWNRGGSRGIHIFARNNELAGYCSVLHALALRGIDGAYGPPRRALILGYGSVGRGAAYALLGRGFADVTIYTQRPTHLVRDRLFGARHLQMRRRSPGSGYLDAVDAHGRSRPLVEALAESQIVVNATLQDTDAPLMYLEPGQEAQLVSGGLIVDVSCDLGMGFPFARPTSFEAPTFGVGPVTYYAVDHSPTYLFEAASWEISRALLPYLGVVLGGPPAWDGSETIRRSIEIRDGRILNPKILSFQRREPDPPHRERPRPDPPQTTSGS